MNRGTTMMNNTLSRRNMLRGGATLAMGITLLPYKALAAEEAAINLFSWDSYLGENTLADFNAATGVTAKIDLYGSNDEMFAKLKAGNPGYDVIIPSSNWIQRMVKADMLLPLDHSKIPNIKNYDPVFMDEEFDPGRKYSLAYVWGTFGIGYRKSKAKNGAPDSWKVLLDSTEYDGRIAIQADQEFALGSALQYLGYGWNSTNATELGKAKDLLISAKKHIKLFAKDNGDSLLASGDVDVCSDFSGDLLGQMTADTTDDLAYILPKEGGNRWQDTMAIAKGAPHPENAHKYINYICDADVNAKLLEAIHYPTPNAAAKAKTSDAYRNNPVIFPSPEQLKKTEPGMYLGEDAAAAREEIWTAVQAA
jgi:spermidine/putrescine transport system substrate-binding protein